MTWLELLNTKQRRMVRRFHNTKDRHKIEWLTNNNHKNYDWRHACTIKERPAPFPSWEYKHLGRSSRCESVPLNRKTRHKVKQALHMRDFDTSKFDAPLPYIT